MVFSFFKSTASASQAAPKAAPETRAVPVPHVKASAAGRLMAAKGVGNTSPRATWAARDSATLARNGFQGNPVGFRCVKLIAEAAASLPLILQDRQQRYEEHELLTLLRRPNPVQGKAELLEALYAQILLSGDGYLELVSRDGTPVELYVLRSDRMALVPGADGWPLAYDYSVNGRKHRFDMQGDVPPICHIRTFHPLDDHYGLSPLQAAGQALDVHNSASRWSKALLDNAARPSGALVYQGVDGQGGLSPDQYDRLQSEMATYHQGAGNAGRPMLLEGGLDWKPMGFSPSEMEFQKTKDSAAREIALAFGVPPMLLGIPGDATYANYQEANRAFYRLTVLPLVQKVCGRLATFLGQHSDTALDLRVDLDQVAALAGERDAQWQRVSDAAFLSAAEKRRMLGLPDLDVAEGST
jgi:HK97 family phage portal protein